MIRKDIRKMLENDFDNVSVLDNPSFDYSIVGISNSGSLIYDFDKMIEEYATEYKCSYLEAQEFIEYNTLRAIPYFDVENKPIIMFEIKNQF